MCFFSKKNQVYNVTLQAISSYRKKLIIGTFVPLVYSIWYSNSSCLYVPSQVIEQHTTMNNSCALPSVTFKVLPDCIMVYVHMKELARIHGKLAHLANCSQLFKKSFLDKNIVPLATTINY